MRGINRQTIGIDVAGISVPHAFVLELMTWSAKALQLAEAKFIPATAVMLDMVGDCGRRDLAVALAFGAERRDAQLISSSFLPALQIIPIAPGFLLGVKSSCGHSPKLPPCLCDRYAEPDRRE